MRLYYRPLKRGATSVRGTVNGDGRVSEVRSAVAFRSSCRLSSSVAFFHHVLMTQLTCGVVFRGGVRVRIRRLLFAPLRVYIMITAVVGVILLMCDNQSMYESINRAVMSINDTKVLPFFTARISSVLLMQSRQIVHAMNLSPSRNFLYNGYLHILSISRPDLKFL